MSLFMPQSSPDYCPISLRGVRITSHRLEVVVETTTHSLLYRVILTLAYRRRKETKYASSTTIGGCKTWIPSGKAASTALLADNEGTGLYSAHPTAYLI